MTTPQRDPQPGPYAAAALRYHAAGWSPLPLPAHAKGPVPKGWTGRDGAWPSGADVWAWTEDHPDGNVALRLPPDVLGVDVDAYDPKPGGLMLAQLEAQLGPLPATWRSTSRDDGTSGIRLYRIPTGLLWPGVLGPGIETIRHAHRYTVAWPSIHPDTGGTYRWITPDGATSLDGIPNPNDLPDLPDAWIEHFTRGEATEQARAGLDQHTSSAWLTARGAGPTCRRVQDALARAMSDLTTGASRHDAALAATNRLVWLAGDGHPGVTLALQQLGATFVAATAGDRGPGVAEEEWDRMILGAVDLAAAAHPQAQPDPCTDPFAGLIPPGTRPDQERPCPPPGPTATTPPPAPTTSTSSTPAPTASAPASSSTTTASGPAAAVTAVGTSTDPAPTPAPTDAASTDDLEAERTTWWPRTLATALGDTDPEPPPTHLHRSDGHAAFYAGRVNGLIGPSESGKTWVALHAVHQALTAGQHVTYLDFEDSERGIVGRLLALGVTPEQLLAGLAYIGPDEPFHPLLPTGQDLREHLQQHAPHLVVLDGFNAAMTIQGWDLNSNKDATAFMQQIVKPLARDDATVVYVDHVAKDTESTAKGGIGAQAKRAMTTGCTLRVDAIKPFGKGQDGKLRIHVDKDRQGDVRGISAPGKTTHWFGDFTLTHAGDGAVLAKLDAPDGFDPQNPATPAAFRPTVYMSRVSAWLQDHPDSGRNEILEAVTGKAMHVKTALRLLVEEGWIDVTKGPNNKSLHSVATPFNELLPPPTDKWGPGGVQVGSGTPVESGGVPGVPDRDVVPSSQDLTDQSDEPAENSKVPGPHSPLTAERVVAGQRVRVNLHTGEVDP
ncbi:bifunctional DNA primase/polymerase [Janibacter terrae]|uniref:bifunctional DNA primase/polymerase n=1 Tax=Janibacter terrae TaxID=103817 RepID=UPI0031F90B35